MYSFYYKCRKFLSELKQIIHILSLIKILNNYEKVIQKKNIILKQLKTFGFYEHDTLGRVFYFGDIPAEAIPYKAKYKVKEDSIEWSINLEKVIYNNKTYNNTKQAIIVTNEIVIFAPNHFFDTIIEPMLNTYYQSGKCYNKEEQKIICDCDVFLELSGITFIIDRYQFFLSYSQLYNQFYSKCIFLIRRNVRSDQWKLGIPFLWTYASLFDYDDHSITFYSQKGIQSTGVKLKNQFSTVKKILLFICFILLLSILFLLYIKKNTYNK